MRKIEALHAQIDELIGREKDYHDKRHPNDNELWRSVAHAKIEMARYSPKHRALMVEAVAAFPTLGRQAA